MNNRVALVIAASLLFSLHIQAQQPPAADADAVIKAVTTAMGTARLRAVQYTGTGSTNPTGQAYTSGGAWPRYTVTKYTMSIDYSVPAMRQELVRIDDAKVPRGGGAGGYNPQTFQGGIRPIPGDIIQNTTIDPRNNQNAAIQFWLTPHGFLKGIAANMATAKTATASRCTSSCAKGGSRRWRSRWRRCARTHRTPSTRSRARPPRRRRHPP